MDPFPMERTSRFLTIRNTTIGLRHPAYRERRRGSHGIGRSAAPQKVGLAADNACGNEGIQQP